MKRQFYKTENFITMAKAIHGERYDYSKVRYKSSAEKVIIICSRHGEFKQAPSQHLKGQGCPYCAYNRPSKEEFMKLITKLYGENIDFSKCTYTHKTPLTSKIILTCKIHGDFTKSVIDLIKGEGCQKCAKDAKILTRLEEYRAIVQQKDEVPKISEAPVSYHAEVQFMPANSAVIVYLWSAPFQCRADAEQLLENMKIFIEMANYDLIDALIVEMRQPILDKSTVQGFIRCLNVNLYPASTLINPVMLPNNDKRQSA